jgi:hypothetical protein
MVGWVTVMFRTTEVASQGTPHWPWIRNARSVFAPIAGPPKGPFGVRVSTARQGATV